MGEKEKREYSDLTVKVNVELIYTWKYSKELSDYILTEREIIMDDNNITIVQKSN